VSNELIHENLKALAGIHNALWLRIPIIPGVNDTREELESMAKFAVSLRSVRQVNLLPYHKTGVAKFRRAGKLYRLGEVNPPSAEYMEAAAQVFAGAGLKVKVGG
jgi:pyruvate formate lyase activating enzyme